MGKRLIILFGSILTLWFIMAIIFICIQSFRHFRTSKKYFRFRKHEFQHPIEHYKSSLSAQKRIELLSHDDNDIDDERTSVYTALSFVSDKIVDITCETNRKTVNEQIPEEQEDENPIIFGPNSNEATFSSYNYYQSGYKNYGYSNSTLTSSVDTRTNFLYYPACRNFAYSQSTIASSIDLNENITAPPSTPINTNHLTNIEIVHSTHK
ncbi:unnamed protein product, partial [Didymodactylos carnosus]